MKSSVSAKKKKTVIKRQKSCLDIHVSAIHGSFSHYVMAATLMNQKNETAAMLMDQKYSTFLSKQFLLFP